MTTFKYNNSGLEDEHPVLPELRHRVYAVFKLALILTWNVVA